ncbi:PepSY domain-containing protein [Longitalea arenae]|uniref:PepSY domain-containing protein n=1 Tax=Longitalea arenae TaxID=2812558 RepID=UPI0019670B7D|nr:PepSY domain-containing protein [Longitalea arenae]
MFRKKIYAWHRTLSLIIAIPVLLWAASGFMHPLMTNIKPQVASQKLAPMAVDSQALRVPLREALQRNNIKAFHDVRLIHIDTNFFYQVQLELNKVPVYLSASNGKLLPSGDWLYAQYLAKQFLEAPQQAAPPAATAATVAMVSEASEEEHDCCNAATACVLKNTTGSKVGNVARLTAFDKEYKYVNRLLPVYRVAFNRPDGIRIYVETTQDRFAFAMDNRRASFDALFQWLHTWSWLDALGNMKLYFIIAICLLALLTALMGIYIFCISKTKKANGHTLLKARRNHRYTAIIGALFTLAWSFSGAWHALAKFTPDDRLAQVISNQFPPTIDLDFARLQSKVQQPVGNLSLVKMNDETWWRVITLPGKPPVTHTAMSPGKSMEAKLPTVVLVSTRDYSILPQGEEQYAAWLAKQFSKEASGKVATVTPVTKFNEEYNFTDKRLPVWRVSFTAPNDERYFVETASGRLAAKVNDIELAEGYSFSVLHKHHFMDWAGKAARDWSTMVWAFVQILMIVIGLMLWLKKKRLKS